MVMRYPVTMESRIREYAADPETMVKLSIGRESHEYPPEKCGGV